MITRLSDPIAMSMLTVPVIIIVPGIATIIVIVMPSIVIMELTTVYGARVAIIAARLADAYSVSA